MAAYYLDTSALIKRYAVETGTAWVTALTAPQSAHEIYTVILTGPEMIAALYRKVRTGESTAIQAQRQAADFDRDWRTQYQVLDVVQEIADEAMLLARRHGLRGYDAVHLATALSVHRAHVQVGLPPPDFVSADNDQIRAAAAEGLAVDNPNHSSRACQRITRPACARPPRRCAG